MDFETWFAIEEDHFTREWNDMSEADQANFTPEDIASFYYDRDYDAIAGNYYYAQPSI